MLRDLEPERVPVGAGWDGFLPSQREPPLDEGGRRPVRVGRLPGLPRDLRLLGTREVDVQSAALGFGRRLDDDRPLNHLARVIRQPREFHRNRAGHRSPQTDMPHRTRNRVPQYEQVAMPNRSTFVGGPPQFGQFRATGPTWPAGTIGCWIGGGGGIVRRPAPDAAAMMMKTITKRNGMQKKGAIEKADPGLPMKAEPIATKNTTTIMTTARTARTAGFCQGLCEGGAWGYQACCGGGGWATRPDGGWP